MSRFPISSILFLFLCTTPTLFAQRTEIHPRPFFNLELFEHEQEEKVSDYAPSQFQQKALFVDGKILKGYKLHVLREVPEAGTAEVTIQGDTLVADFVPQPSGHRLTFSIASVESEGMDLSDFQNGALEFMIKGPPYTEISLLFESGGGMFGHGETADQQLLLDGQWQNWIIPLRDMDRMVAPGAHYVRAIEHEEITAPFKISLYSREPVKIEVRNVVLKNYPQTGFGPERKVLIDMGRPINEWDGFGVNYVESSRSRDPVNFPEDYSGFSMLQEHQRQEILDLIFGADGLKPDILKMFTDPFREGKSLADNDNDDPFVLNMDAFDHESTTHWMRYFARHGLQITREQGRDLEVLACLYGPPGWMTKQQFVRGRDLNPELYPELAEYMVSWVKYLRDEMEMPVKYLSIHNEGDSPNRWDTEGKMAGRHGADHNSFWRPHEVVEMLNTLPPILKANGLEDILVSAGEYSTWGHAYNPNHSHFHYARDIFEDEEAIDNLGIFTSHSFWYPTDRPVNLLKVKRPDLKFWTTSMSWNGGYHADVSFLDFFRREIYDVKVNGLLTWATTYTPNSWISPYPTHSIGIYITHNDYRVEPAYYYYRQLTRAGRKGMHVAWAASSIPGVRALAFSGKETEHPDAFILYNMNGSDTLVTLDLENANHTVFETFTCAPNAYATPNGPIAIQDGKLSVKIPAYTSIAFYGHP